jgi:hypothetical protein
MKKLALLSSVALLAIACSSPANNAGANRSNSTAASTNINASSSTLNENAYTSASNSELGNLTPSGKAASEIVGKTASEIKLWENKEIDPRLRKMMGADFATMKKSWNVETPIKKFGDFLMMTGCEKNNCAANRYVIFMDMGEGNINVVHIGKDTTKNWNEYGDVVLPPPFADELATMKSKR